jgi:hypothetical protein
LFHVRFVSVALFCHIAFIVLFSRSAVQAVGNSAIQQLSGSAAQHAVHPSSITVQQFGGTSAAVQ